MLNNITHKQILENIGWGALILLCFAVLTTLFMYSSRADDMIKMKDDYCPEGNEVHIKIKVLFMRMMQ